MTRPAWDDKRGEQRLARDLASAGELLEGVQFVDMGELYDMPLPELHYMLFPMFSEGVTLFAGKPKTGKSTLLRQLLWKANTGGEMFGAHVFQGHSLFISMEENMRQTRIKLRQQGSLSAELVGVNSAYEWKKGNEGIAMVRAYMELFPRTRLIAIDSLSAFREPVNSREPQLQQDYRSIEGLKKICNDYPGLAIVMLHHTIKGAVDDPMDAIAGSNGLAAVADMLLVLMEQDGRFRLHCKGRNWEIEHNDFELGRDSGIWTMIGEWSGFAFRDSSHEKEVYAFIKENGAVTANTLIHRAGIPKTCVYDALAKLSKNGLLKKEANVYSA